MLLLSIYCVIWFKSSCDVVDNGASNLSLINGEDESRTEIDVRETLANAESMLVVYVMQPSRRGSLWLKEFSGE